MTANELQNIVALGETSKIQFKRELDNQDKMAAEMIAFANAKGGMLLFGVADKTGELVGLEYKQLQNINNRVATIANELVKPQIFITTDALTVEGKNILIVNIDEGVQKPYKDNNGTIWLKQGADKRRLTDNAEILRLFQAGGKAFVDEMTVYGTSINDISEYTFGDYFRHEFKSDYQELGLTYEEALRAKRVLQDGKVTLGGLLFFGKEPQKFNVAFTIKTVSFVGNSIGGLNYRSKPEDLKGTIPELFKQAMMFLKSNLKYRQENQGFNSIGIPEISIIALEEIVQNALIHRDYTKNSPIRLLVFDNRLEIISPGKLPNSLTVEEIRYGNPVIRNHLIVAYSIHSLPYSGLGSGLKRALKEQPNIELINDTEGELFKVIIPRNI
jgi:predicted HTH transcriptional regulator